jgi:hypothetical protein
MQQNVILRIFLIVALTLCAVAASFQIFTMQGNVLGNSFRVLTPLAIVIGLAAPRFAFYLLLMAGAYLDLIKRFMILDSRFSDTDLAFLLGFAPALVTGLVLKFVLAAISKSPTVSAREVKLFIVTTLLCGVLGAAQIFMSGELRSAGSAVNVVAYLYMPLLVPRIFRNISEMKSLMISAVIIYLPAALWAMHQAYYGLEAFEMQYLLSGMTIEIRQLDEEVFRNMGTMVSAHALSMVASILAVSLIIPISWKTGTISFKVWANPLRLICIWLFVTGAYLTFSRTGWICAFIAIMAFLCLQNRTLTYAAFFGSIGGIITLYLSADYLLHSRVMVETQLYLFDKLGTSAEARQMLVLGTLDARLESMASFATDPTIWTPFGMKAAGSTAQINWIHDILTENLIRLGYIPLAILVFGILTIIFLTIRAMFRMPRGPNRTMATYFFALALGMISGGFSQGTMILYFPINFFWCLFLGVGFAMFYWQKMQKTESIKSIEMSTQPTGLSSLHLPSRIHNIPISSRKAKNLPRNEPI